VQDHLLRELVKTFQSYPWHDAKLESIHIGAGDVSVAPSITLWLNMADQVGQQSTWARHRLSFVDCRAIFANIDLIGAACSGSEISGAYCHVDSELRKRRAEEIVSQGGAFELGAEQLSSLDKYVLFTLDLIHPGGSIQVLAMDYRLEPERLVNGLSPAAPA